MAHEIVRDYPRVEITLSILLAANRVLKVNRLKEVEEVLSSY
jgi:hypothetical protein